MKLPIDVVPNKIPPVFQWRQTVDTLAGKTTVDNEGMVQASIEAALVELIEFTKRVVAERDVFKQQNNELMERVASQSQILSRRAERLVGSEQPQMSSIKGSKRS